MCFYIAFSCRTSFKAEAHRVGEQSQNNFSTIFRKLIALTKFSCDTFLEIFLNGIGDKE